MSAFSFYTPLGTNDLAIKYEPIHPSVESQFWDSLVTFRNATPYNMSVLVDRQSVADGNLLRARVYLRAAAAVMPEIQMKKRICLSIIFNT